jgi:hypothetical protein
MADHLVLPIRQAAQPGRQFERRTAVILSRQQIMPGRRAFLRRRHVAAGVAGTGHYRGSSRSGGRVFGVVLPLQAERAGELAAERFPGRRRVIPAQAVSSRWPSVPMPARCGRPRPPAATAPSWPARSTCPSSVRTIGAMTVTRNAQPSGSTGGRSCPAATSADGSRLVSSGRPRPNSPGQPRSGPGYETPEAVTAATAKTPLLITCPRRSPGAAAFTAKTPKNGLEITAGLRAFSLPSPLLSVMLSIGTVLTGRRCPSGGTGQLEASVGCWSRFCRGVPRRGTAAP